MPSQATMAPAISVILPSYRAAGLAVRSVAMLAAALEETRHDWEIVVVDDGGHDFPPTTAGWDSRIRLIRLPRNRGKGAAVRAGLREARGRVRIFTDVDLPFGCGALPLIAEYILHRGFHLVVGDRTLPESRYDMVGSAGRRLASAVFSSFVGRLVTGGFHDTQCGLKAIRGDVADALLPLLRIDRFAFDVELIYVALRHKADIKRIPVVLQANETSSVRLFRDSIRGAWDVGSIKLNQLRGRYTSAALATILAADIEAAAAKAGAAGFLDADQLHEA